MRALGGALRQFSSPPSNELFPLSNDEYDEADHEEDLLERRSHRSGMLLNSEELVSLVHLPSASVRSEKLTRERRKTKAAPAAACEHSLVLGENRQAGKTTCVTLSPDQRSRHTYLIGATGTGKSHLLLNLIRQDIEHGEGVGVLDPHGDLIDRVLSYVPEARANDVVLLDPADEEYPVGFNVLAAHSALEKNLLASDLVAVFRRLSTSWGDQMNSVLANAILAFLESDQGGTLAELRRFLVEQDFRRRFLATVRDPEVVYYWEREFPLLSGRPQAPILTRLDAFLRPRTIRAMVAQQENRLDLSRIMNERKIFLAKLAQGAIGEENAYLLGSLLVSKFHQLALSRQGLAEADRRPFYLYVDEFQHFVTPSMASILAGARKYGLGLTLAHQDLRQLESRDENVAAAVLANAGTRVCFRVGDGDARKLAQGFSFFGPEDLQNLGVGEAICRIERAEHDFNLTTPPLPAIDEALARERQERVVAHSRAAYGTPRQTVEAALRETAVLKPSLSAPEPREDGSPAQRARIEPFSGRKRPEKLGARGGPAPVLPEAPGLGRGGQQHRYLQQLIKRWAESRGYRITIEKAILDGLGSVDVALEKGERLVACEISVTTSPEIELGNVQKCLAAGFEQVLVVSADRKALSRAQAYVAPQLEEKDRERVRFLTPEELFSFLEARDAHAAAGEETVRGYKVKVQYRSVGEDEKEAKRQAISKVILGAVKRLRGKDDSR